MKHCDMNTVSWYL